MSTRRVLIAALAALLAAALSWGTATAGVHPEGQRQADQGPANQGPANQGQGTYLNPLLAGDRPDPTILKDGNTWYATFSSFESYPGLVIWSSKDLLNWTPVAATLKTYVGSVWAPCLVKWQGRYLIYFPGRTDTYRSNYVIWADHFEGPWSEPIDLKLPKHIDPGFAAGDDGHPWLFLSGGDRVALTDDGLATIGTPEHVADPFPIPVDWDIESQSVEGPKITRHNGWYYMIWAEGGTAGPPTGHMVVVARSRSLDGPWTLDPQNPIIRTRNKSEPWWSKGHGSLVETPNGWYMVYHAYENGYVTLGRQMLMEPVEWTEDGWFRVADRDLLQPIPAPYPTDADAPSSGGLLSDDFATDSLGLRWSFYKGGTSEAGRARFGARNGRGLDLLAKGTRPADATPLLETAPDQAYEIETEITLEDGATAGVLLFYDDAHYVGLALSHDKLIMHRYGKERAGAKPAGMGDHLFIRMRNDHHIVSFYTSADGKVWTKYGVQMEVSGYNHNVAGGFLALKPGIYTAGSGRAHFSYWRYRALP